MTYEKILNVLTSEKKSTALIAKQSGFSFNTAARHLSKMRDKGRAERIQIKEDGRSKNYWVKVEL